MTANVVYVQLMSNNATAKARRLNDPEFAQRERDYQRARRERLKGSPEWAALQWASSLRNRYGITPEQYHAMHAAQNGVCAICGLPERIIDDRTREVRRLAVDHDEATGRVRGLLCFHCNSAIGKFQHSSILLLKAVRYLRLPV